MLEPTGSNVAIERSPSRVATSILALSGIASSIACQEGYTSNSYAVAATFAVAAGALQVAESVAAARQAATPSCALQTCAGCCDAKGTCWSGGGDSTCGAGGARCEDCTQSDARCAGGACYSSGADPGPWTSTWNASTTVSSMPGPSVRWSTPATSGCEASACPRCTEGVPCCSTAGTCACTLGTLCP
jgi:hypothetical protein